MKCPGYGHKNLPATLDRPPARRRCTAVEPHALVLR